jgi:hypothetical protein
MPAAESTFPDFFADAPQLTLRDPLAEFLGAARGGLMTYRYADAVRLAGHSCPTVAGAWLMTVHGLRALYGQETPVRGEIDVLMRDGREDGANGVIATVVQLLTGAAPETGFHGIGGRFGRHQRCASTSPCRARWPCAARTPAVPCRRSWTPRSCPGRTRCALLPRAAAGRASADELARFGALWQDRVRRMLVEHADDPRLVRVAAWDAAVPA